MLHYYYSYSIAAFSCTTTTTTTTTSYSTLYNISSITASVTTTATTTLGTFFISAEIGGCDHSFNTGMQHFVPCTGIDSVTLSPPFMPFSFLSSCQVCQDPCFIIAEMDFKVSF